MLHPLVQHWLLWDLHEDVRVPARREVASDRRGRRVVGSRASRATAAACRPAARRPRPEVQAPFGTRRQGAVPSESGAAVLVSICMQGSGQTRRRDDMVAGSGRSFIWVGLLMGWLGAGCGSALPEPREEPAPTRPDVVDGPGFEPGPVMEQPGPFEETDAGTSDAGEPAPQGRVDAGTPSALANLCHPALSTSRRAGHAEATRRLFEAIPSRLTRVQPALLQATSFRRAGRGAEGSSQHRTTSQLGLRSVRMAAGSAIPGQH